MIDLSQYYGLIQFSGEDAGTFLQNQLTCDVREVSEHQASYGGYCTPKGRVLVNFLLFRYKHRYILQLPKNLCESLQKRLSLYKLRAKVIIENVSQEYTCIGLAGSHLSQTLGRLFTSLPTLNQPLRFVDLNDHAFLCLASNRIQLISPSTNAIATWEHLHQQIQIADIAYWNHLTIQAGIPVVLMETQEKFLPQMINLDAIGALSFKKGCYPGQEIVARTQYLGKLKRRMYLCHITTSDIVNPSDSLYCADSADQSCGSIVNATTSQSHDGYDVLAVIQQSSVEAGEIHWGSLLGPVIQIKTLPYLLP
ncbi:folate-binding protein YgfZ [Nitrosomonas sp. PY1]|uniref:CAF17-like 4Fe-4S cluster assembly/insertion protein YgfZ n=1 Tax=Nitrosomonas sp. PY1 TaxID=1803906 RepID=UPI001FC89988|nr:folate-binding protein [Nitrosomonas sp. PY1]